MENIQPSTSCPKREIAEIHTNAETVIEILDPEYPMFFRVPNGVRDLNANAYTPQLVSIGPYHHGRPNLQEMQSQKENYYFKLFLQQTKKTKAELLKFYNDNFGDTIQSKYARPISLCDEKFKDVILIDACFIIEIFFLKQKEKLQDYIFKNSFLRSTIRLDLIMFENQIPFSVLTKLYYEFFKVHVDLSNYEEKGLPSFLDLFKNFLGINMPDFMEDNIKHFTHLQARSWLHAPNKDDLLGTQNIIHLNTATKLHKAGVDFILQSKKDECLNTKIEVSHLPYWRKFIPWLSTLQLELGVLPIDDDTECLMRNVMAMEQCQEHTSVLTPICDYMCLMDLLIDTEQDVDILVEKKVITNYLGSTKEVMDMINNLSKNISISQNFIYQRQCSDVIEFSENWYNHAKATLRRVYFKDIWTGSSTAVAFLIVIFTVISTIEAIWSIKEKNS